MQRVFYVMVFGLPLARHNVLLFFCVHVSTLHPGFKPYVVNNYVYKYTVILLIKAFVGEQ